MSQIYIDDVDSTKMPSIYLPNIKKVRNYDEALADNLVNLYRFLCPSVDLDGDVLTAAQIIKEMVKKINESIS